MLNILKNDAAAAKSLATLKNDIAAAEQYLEEISGAQLARADIVASIKAKLESEVDAAQTDMQFLTHPGYAPLPAPSLPLLYWIYGDDLLDRIMKRFDEMKIDYGLPASERKAAIKKQQEVIEQLMEREEREFCKLETAGILVARRANPNAEMLLRVWNQ